MLKFLQSIFILIGIISTSYSQTPVDTTDYAAEIAKLEAELDSFGIFMLIDSVLLSDFSPPSELNIRIGYNSNVLNAGRNYGLNQHGISPGVSFFHSKGWFADLTGFWNSEFEPKYNLTMLSGGYMGILGNKFSYSFTAEKWFYHYETESELNSLPKNSIGLSFNYNHRYFTTGLNYSYLFGSSTAHRLIGSINGIIKIPTFWKIKSITLLPGFSTLYGNENILIQFNGDILEELKTNEYLQQNLRDEEFQNFLNSVNFSSEEAFALRRIDQNNRLNDRQKRTRKTLIYLQNEDILNYVYSILDTQQNSYGIMNYSLSLPVSITFKSFSTFIAYTYSIPQKLPGETLDIDPVGFFSLTFSYRLPLR
jgi:hypothetical protein